MKTMKHFKNSLLLLSFLPMFSGCSDSETEFSANVDVIYVSKIIDNETVYGESYYAYGNSPIQSTTMSTPSGTTLQLDAYSSGYVFAKVPENDSDYSSSEPTGGTYTFTITGNDGETQVLSDEQSFYGLNFTQIDSMSYYSSYDGFYVSWDTVTGADSYIVCLYDTTGSMIFSSYAIEANYPKFSVVSGYYGTWDKAPVIGNKYKLQIQSVIYDGNANSDNYFYNVQEISYSDFEITWK
jgi:hypothetical protein